MNKKNTSAKPLELYTGEGSTKPRQPSSSGRTTGRNVNKESAPSRRKPASARKGTQKAATQANLPQRSGGSSVASHTAVVAGQAVPEAVVIWQPQLNTALMDMRRTLMAMFESAVNLGNLLADAKHALGNDVHWLTALNLSISEREEDFYVALGKICDGGEDLFADDMPTAEIIELFAEAYHAAIQSTRTMA